jgi:hypothetical protein
MFVSARSGGFWQFTAFLYRNFRQGILQPKPSSRRQRWTKRSAPDRGLRCFEACFAGEKTSTLGNGRMLTAGPADWRSFLARRGFSVLSLILRGNG